MSEIYEAQQFMGEGQRYERATFNRCAVLLDSNQYQDCIFNDCELVYAGGEHVMIGGCQLNGVRFVLDGPALNTIKFLVGVGHIKNGGQELVTQFLECVRAGVIPDSETLRPLGVSLQ